MGFFKTLFFLIVLILLLAGGGYYYALPWFVEHYVAPNTQQMEDLSDRLKAVEDFVGQERELREQAVLPMDAKLPALVSQINVLSADARTFKKTLAENRAAQGEFESRLGKRLDEMVAESNALVRKELEEMAAGLAKDRAALEKVVASVDRGVKVLRAAQTLANVMGHLVKVKSDVQARNTGKALTELGLVEKRLEEISAHATEGEEAPVMQNALQSVRAVRRDMDEGNPAVLDRIDLLWNDLESLSLLFLAEGPAAGKMEAETRKATR